MYLYVEDNIFVLGEANIVLFSPLFGEDFQFD